ncbi:MAG: hypothetical protein ACYC99_09045 [Candidatus Geothermincolia bacterium]
MEPNSKERGHIARSVGQVALAVIVVLAIAGLTAYAWKAQGRYKEDASLALMRQTVRNAEVAKSLLPMIDKLEALRGTVAQLNPGDPDYARYSQQLSELQNLIGEEMPALVYLRDRDGNVTLVGAEMARAHLETIISAVPAR